MSGTYQVDTPRLRLRQWRDNDLESFIALNADCRVMEHFPGTLSGRESAELMARLRGNIIERGWGFFAVDVKPFMRFIGFTGLNVFSGLPVQSAPLPIGIEGDGVEIGWRLLPRFWGRGFASEAAMAALYLGFRELGLSEIVAFTSLTNSQSMAVMQRIGMQDTGKNFRHPKLEPDSRLSEHVLYRITATEFDPGEKAEPRIALTVS